MAGILILKHFSMRYLKIKFQSILYRMMSHELQICLSGLSKNLGEPFPSGYFCRISLGYLTTSLKGTRKDEVTAFLILEISASKKIHYFHKFEGTLSEAASIQTPSPNRPPPKKRSIKVIFPSHLLFPTLVSFDFLYPPLPFLTLW